MAEAEAKHADMAEAKLKEEKGIEGAQGNEEGVAVLEGESKSEEEQGESKQELAESGESKDSHAEDEDDEEDVHPELEQAFTYEGIFNTKAARVQAACAAEESAPRQYVENSRKEELCLQYVGNFVRQFEALFPSRKKLFVTPRNEFGAQKFVCTTVRPTQLPFKALYSVSSAASFFADFMQYEPLADPLEPPEVLPSPTLTLKDQAGDAFDLSTLLCSYLLGSGFDAYCVYGYAPDSVTLLNLTTEPCPLIGLDELPCSTDDANELHIEDLRGEGEDRASSADAEGDVASAVNAAEEKTDDSRTSASGEGTAERQQEGDEAKVSEGAAAGAEGADPDGDAGAGETAEGAQTGDTQGSEAKSSDEGGAAAADGEGDDEAVAAEGGEEGADGADEGKSAEDGGASAQAGGEGDDEDPYAITFSGVKESVYLKKLQQLEDDAEAKRRAEMDDDLDVDLDRDPESDLEVDGDGEDGADKADRDPLAGSRVHCWVLVRAGKRGVSRTFFIEPSTGRQYDVHGSPYLGVEALWNNSNYWVNMQCKEDKEDKEDKDKNGEARDNETKTDSSEGDPAAAAVLRVADAANTTYDLDFDGDWEHVFYDEAVDGEQTRPEGDSDDAEGLPAEAAPVDGDSGASEAEKSGNVGGGPAAAPAQTNSASSASSRSIFAGGPSDGDDAQADGGPQQQQQQRHKEMVLDLPGAWPAKLALSRDAFRRRYGATGQRTQLFFKAKLESYAPHLHAHGVVKRLVLFRDRARTVPVEVREFFANRRDKLQLRVRWPLKARVLELFGKGRASGLFSVDEVVGRKREVAFFEGARLDGLLRRVEVAGESIEEVFSGRDDHLERMVTLLACGAGAGAGAGTGAGAGRGAAARGAAGSKAEAKVGEPGAAKNTMTLPRSHQGEELVIAQMQEHFAADVSREPGTVVSTRAFHVSEAKIAVVFHYAKGRITRSSRVFHKRPGVEHEVNIATGSGSGSGSGGRGGRSGMSRGGKAALRPSQVEEEFSQHLQAEKDCYQRVRDAEREMQDVLALRKREEAAIVLEKSIFDAANERTAAEYQQLADGEAGKGNGASNGDGADGADGQGVGEVKSKDPRVVEYLSPFLAHLLPKDGHAPAPKVTRAGAEAARDACLKSLKERLLERANIIQCRLDEENAQLAKKQAAFQRSRDHVDGADQHFERFCSEAMFRIQILEQRLARHEESALSVYANLDQRLRSDPRLEVLYC